MESCRKKFGYQQGKRPDRHLSRKISLVQTTVAANRRHAYMFPVGKGPIRLQFDSSADIKIVTVKA